MAVEYRLEIDLMRKSRPKWNSKRCARLTAAMHANGIYGARKCEICGTMLLNPQSILIHQGGFCQSKIANNKKCKKLL